MASIADPCFFSLLLFLLLCTLPPSLPFQSDELQEEEEDWGIVGSPHIEQITSRSSRRSNFPSTDSGSPASPSDSRVKFQLEHSFGDSDFSPAGSFSARLRNLHSGGKTLTKLRLSRNEFTTEEQEAFQALVKLDGFYRIRVPANVLNPGQQWILSSVKARCLSSSNLHERFAFYVEKGNIISVAYGASQCLTSPSTNYVQPNKWIFYSHIVLKTTEQVARPLPSISEVSVETGDDGQPKKPPEKSFWAKYWMYIVPLGLIIMNAITQVANMPDESAGNGAQGTPQRTVAAAPRRR